MAQRRVIRNVLLALAVAVPPLACTFPHYRLEGDASPGPQCDDQLTNGDETDVDCGGSTCSQRCPGEAACVLDSDCISASCTDGKCEAGHCDNRLKDFDEGDVDCGGDDCAVCEDDAGCIVDRDCASGVCRNQTCQEPSCSDQTKNGLEVDEDCGGPCDACGDGKSCVAQSDCTSGVCSQGECQAASCSDSLKNGSETDVDCGGGCDSLCGEGDECTVNTDCALDRCSEGICSANLVTDPGFENGIASWDDWVGGTNTIVTTDVHSGANALRQDDVSGGRGQTLAAQPEASSCYQVCYWAKAKDSSWNGQVLVRFIQDSATWECFGPASGANRPSWKQYCYEFATGPGPVTESYLYFWLNASTPAAPNLIDDISLVRERDASTCLGDTPATSAACVQL